MTRIDVLEKRMFDVMPFSPFSVQGPRLARTRIYAASIAGDASMGAILGVEEQMKEAEDQMKEGAILQRVNNVQPPPIPTPPDPLHPPPIPATDWTQSKSAYWVFTPVAAPPGASGVFLDRWGRMIQVPRISTETDAQYAKRIIAESISPSCTNVGMALLIDLVLGVTGTRVIEASNFDTPQLHYNAGLRYNNGLRYMPIHLFNAPSYWNTFIVFLPVDLPHNSFTNENVNDIVNRHKAAGNRKIATITPSNVYPDQ